MEVNHITIYRVSQDLSIERDDDTNSLTLNFGGFKTRMTHAQWAELRKLTNQLKFLEDEFREQQNQLILAAGTEPF